MKVKKFKHLYSEQLKNATFKYALGKVGDGIVRRSVNRKLKAVKYTQNKLGKSIPLTNKVVLSKSFIHGNSAEGFGSFFPGMNKKLGNTLVTNKNYSKLLDKLTKPINGNKYRGGSRIYVGVTDKTNKRTRNSVIYHEMGHATGKMFSNKNRKINIRYGITKTETGRKPLKRDNKIFTEEVRAWKNSLDQTRGTGQKRRISPIVMLKSLNSYEVRDDLPKGTGLHYTNILLRYNRRFNKNPNLKSKIGRTKRGFVASRKLEARKNKLANQWYEYNKILERGK
jgi:hypothetical protein